MKISLEKLLAESATTGFRSDMLEKVVRLLGLLQSMQQHPFLDGKLVLNRSSPIKHPVFTSEAL